MTYKRKTMKGSKKKYRKSNVDEPEITRSKNTKGNNNYYNINIRNL